MSKKTKVLVFGYFGKKSQIQEGQSVKTRNMSRIFKEMGCDVEEFDTESFRYDKLAIFKMVRMLFKVGSINSIFYFLHKTAEPFNCLEQDNLA